jgi:DNA invertase Pin-like site-specific DNA recombinase
MGFPPDPEGRRAGGQALISQMVAHVIDLTNYMFYEILGVEVEDMKTALYARVSTQNHHQDPELQIGPMKDFCGHTGREVVEIYIDHGVSGTRESRPELNRLMADAAAGKFESVVVWKFDRFARSAKHLLKALETFQSHGISFASVTESVDTSTPMGKLVFTILGAVAEMERSLIVERIRAGVRNARLKGSKIGRPRAAEFDIDAIRARVAAGEQRQNIAKQLGVSPALITKRLKAT